MMKSNLQQGNCFPGSFQKLMFLCVVITSMFLHGSRAYSQGRIFAKFGNIEGSSTTEDYEMWTQLDVFSVTSGALGSNLQVFEADFEFELDQTYVPLLQDSLGFRSMPIEIEFTATYEEGMFLPYLEYNLTHAVVGPLNLSVEDNQPMVSGKILSTDRMQVKHYIRDGMGRILETLETNYDFGKNGGSSLLSSLEGDYDLDGRVDLEDYEVWKTLYGQGNTVADGEGDGDTDGRDYLHWQQHRRPNAQVAAATATVPEPSTLALTALLAQGLLVARRGRV